MVDTIKHRKILMKILHDIFTNAFLASRLAFKGGTAAMFLYELPRFSVDLDFDLIHLDQQEKVFQEVSEIISNYGTLKRAKNMSRRMFFLLSYHGKKDRDYNIKVDINKVDFGSTYEMKKILGVPVRVMRKEDMMANKLVALSERMTEASRDIYDTWYFLKHDWPINKTIVEERTGMPFSVFLNRTIDALSSYDATHILSGLGDLLPDQDKQWVKTKLRDETLFFLRLAREGESFK